MPRKTTPTKTIILESNIFERCKWLYAGISQDESSDDTFSFDELVNTLINYGLKKYHL